MRLATGGPGAPIAPAYEVVPSVELATTKAIQTIVPSEFFKPGGGDQIIAALKNECRELAATLDISREGDRAALASLAYKIARSKTALDDAGEKLIVESRAFVTQVNASRKVYRDDLDAFKAEIRKPLTDFEQVEETRKADHEMAIQVMSAWPSWASDNWQRAPVADIAENLSALRLFNRDWQEFSTRGKFAHEAAVNALVEALERRERHDRDQAELARLRAEEAERKERERLQAIADEAAAKERRAAEERAAEVARAAEAERQRIENERFEAESRAKQAEAQRVEAEKRAAQDLADAEARRVREAQDAAQRAREAAEQAQREAEEAERIRKQEAEWAEQKRIAAEKEAARLLEAERVAAEKRQQEAVEAERKRVADEAERVRLETEKRERNKKHRSAIESAAIDAVESVTRMSPEDATAVIRAISEGLIPNVVINY